MPVPKTPLAPAARDLSDEEFAELEELLVQTPEPLEPCDAVMLDGFLCGVLVQPVLLEPDTWLPHVFDFEGQPLPDDVDTAWLERTRALILRRHAALNRAMAEDGWFHPLILEFDEDDPLPTPPEGEPDPMAGLSPISQSLMPWVAGFQHAALCFPDLSEMPDDAVMAALARLYRHLPAETDEEREVVATLDREQPLATLDDAIEDL
ncbi:MAG TPA: YecA family protein, partial [Albitalea sp.]|nr:YecA family protein [Albitalea sp.]